MTGELNWSYIGDRFSYAVQMPTRCPPSYRVRIPRATVTFAALALAFLMGSCGGGDGGTGPGPGPGPGPGTTPTPSAAMSTVTLTASSVASGSTATVTLQVKDASGTNLSTAGLSVAFSLSGTGTSDGTLSATADNGNGTYTAILTATTAGTARTIAATMGGVAITSALPSVTVTPGAFSATQSQLTTSSATVASGSSATLTLRLRDAAGNALTTGGATVAFSLGSGTSGGTLGSVTDAGNGTYTTTFTATTVGTPRVISASVGGTAVSSASPSVTTLSGPPSAVQSMVEASSTGMQVGSTATLTLRARDAAGNAMTAGGLAVIFTKGAGTSDGTIGTTTDGGNGTYTATFTATAAGTARAIGATMNGAAVTTPLPAITVTAAPPGGPGPISPVQSTVTTSAATMLVGATVTFSLQAKDAAGTNLTSGGASIVFSLTGTGTSSGTIGTVNDAGNGTYSATFTATTAGTPRTVSATIGGTTVATTLPTITVTAPPPGGPGPISPATSIVTVSSATVASGLGVTVSLQAKDAAGVNLTTGGATIVFSLAGTGTSTGTFGAVTDNANGTYTTTFTGATAGSARTIAATVNGAAVTTTQPAITVVTGAISTAQSTVTTSSSNITAGGTATFTLQAKDAGGNNVTSGGATVVFSTSGGSSTGTIGSVTDAGGGAYTATFTGTAAGTALTVNATINATAVTSTLPTITVYTPGMTLSSSSALLNATAGQAAPPQLFGVFANGGATVAGLQASVSYTTPSIAACQSSNWLGTPAFDVTTASPAAVVTLTPTAAALGIYSCTATVTISSTTPGIASQMLALTFAVARGAVAQTAVQLVMMGNAGNPSVQQVAPDARVLITNGGRGVITGLHATVESQVGTGDTSPWITNSDLTWEPTVTDTNARTAPRTLVVRARVAPGFASATVRVRGVGMTDITFPLQVLFNTAPELVTNPRGVAINGFAGGANVFTSVVAFNQNRDVPNELKNIRLKSTYTLPSWLAASFTALTVAGIDTASTVGLTFYPAGLLADSTVTDTVRLIADECTPGSGTCTVTGTTKEFGMPVRFVVERGLVVSVADARIFAPAGTASVTQDVAITNGGSTTISGLALNVGGAAWLSGTFTGGTAVPSTLRLSANPTGYARGTVLNTTVTISASSPSGVPARSFPVTLRVY